MSEERRVREAAAGIRADRVAERRRSAESLKSILQGERVAKNVSPSTWEYLFTEVHDYVLKEMEKFDANRPSSSNIISLCTSLLDIVISSANKYECYVDCNKLLDNCFEVLRSNRLVNTIGNMYINMIVKHILPVSHYLEIITPHQWADLFEIGIEQCNNDKIDSLITSQLLLVILKEGVTRCHLVLPIRDNLTLLENLFISKNNESKHHLQENYLEIGILIIENVGAESRLAVCRFTELILQYTLKFYEQTSISYKRKKLLLFKFFRSSIILHHPNGRSSQETGSFANSWESWNQSLTSMFQLLVAESLLINQHYEKNINSQYLAIDDELFSEYVKFSVELCHQAFNGHINIESRAGTSSNNAKRNKLEFHNFLTLHQVLNNLQDVFYPWINILAEYIRKYGQTLTDDDTYKCLNSLFTLSTYDEKSLQQPSLFECIAIIYEKIKDKDWNEKYIEKSYMIWNMSLRKTSTQNEIFNSCHKIIQTLLLSKNFQPSLNSLIKAYFDRNMPYSNVSVQTLSILLRKYGTKISNEHVRLQITKWVLESYINLTCRDNISLLLFQLCVKENLSQTAAKNVTDMKEEYVFQNLFENMENFMLISDFEMEILQQNNNDVCEDNLTHSVSLSMYQNVFKLILESVIENLSKNNSMCKDSNSFLPEILINVDVLLKFFSLLSDYDIDEYKDTFRNQRFIILETLDIINTNFPSHLNNRQNINEKMNLLKYFKNLFVNGRYNEEISTFIREKTYKEIIEMLLSFVNQSDQEKEVDNFGLMETDSEVIMSTDYCLKAISIDIICNYCCKESRYSNPSLEIILQSDLYDFKIENDFNIAYDLILFILNNFKEDDMPISNILILLQQMCKSSFRDNIAAFKILSLLFCTLKPVSVCDNANSKNNCIIMLKSFLSRCNVHYYSVKTMGQALKCLSWILNYSKLPNWGTDLEDKFTEYLESNIFAIRLYSSYCLHLYILNVAPTKYNELSGTLLNIFTLHDTTDLTSFVISDEGANRTATVLHCLAMISLSSPVWDKKALALLLNIGCRKNIDIKLITKVVQMINKFTNLDIISHNFLYIINYWFSTDIPIENFPAILTECQSVEDFYYKFRHILITQELYWVNNVENRKVINALVQTKNISVDQIISECVPDLVILCLCSLNFEDSNEDLNLRKLLNKKFKIELSGLNDVSFNEILNANIDKILFGIVTSIFDESNIKEIFNWDEYLPCISKPTITLNKFQSIINYLKKALPFNIMKKILVDEPSFVQKLLVDLWSLISVHYTLERRLMSLYHFWVFCKILDLQSPINSFICNFIIRSLLIVIDEHNDKKKFNFISVAACRVLYDLLDTMLSQYFNVISTLIPLIVSSISQFTCKNNSIKIEGLKILNLVFKNKEHTEEIFEALDPLPDSKLFIEINEKIQNIYNIKYNSLEKHIIKFLNGNKINRAPGLKLLYQKLTKCREELGDMFDKLNKIKGFSEDCNDSKLHNLIRVLMEISSYKNDEEASLLASKCLGEIGVCNLHTLVVQTSSDSHVTIKNPKKCFTHIIFHQIENMIFDSNPAIVKSASKALKSLLSFQDGKALLGDSNKIMMPFLSQKRSLPSSCFDIISPKFNTYINRPEIWYDFNNKEHAEWITDLVVSALKSFSDENCFSLDLVDICQLKYSVSETCFPSLIGLILSIAKEEEIYVINRHIRQYFDRYYKLTFNLQECNETQYNKMDKSKNCFSIASVKCMLQLIQFIRLQIRYYDWEGFSFNYLPIVWAAYSTGSYFMAILYGELWCNEQMDNVPPKNAEAVSSYEDSQKLLTIMRKSYQKIGNADALQGCGLGHLSNLEGRRNHYVFSGHFSDAFLMQDILLSSKNTLQEKTNDNVTFSENLYSDNLTEMNTSSVRNFASCLYSSGLYHLSERYMQSFENSSQFDDIKFDCFWRLGDWSLHVDSSLLDTKLNSNHIQVWSAHRYSCLKNALSRNVEINDFTLSKSLNKARQYLILDCKQYGLKSCQMAYQLMGNLQLLQEIEDFGNTTVDDYPVLIEQWSTKKLLPFCEFKNIEPILNQRLLMFENIIKNSEDTKTKMSIIKLQFDYAELALQNDYLQICNRWLNMTSETIKTIVNLSDREQKPKFLRLDDTVHLLEGKVAWKCGHNDVALHLIKNLIMKETSIDKNIYASCLMQYGSWMVETRRESSQDILNNYLLKSLNVLGSDGRLSTKLDAYLTIAKFTDGEYKQIDSYIKSPAFVNKIKCMERCKDTAKTLKEKRGVISKEQHKAMIFNDRQRQIDEMEISNTEGEREQYLQLAMRYYLLSLSEGVENDFAAFRVISLWLENPAIKFYSDDDKSLLDFFLMIPSRKFLTLLPQLAPRLNYTKGDDFQKNLYELIKKCAMEHPHHALPILLALKNANKDFIVKNPSSSKETEEAYVITAKKLLHTLEQSNDENLRTCIKEMEHLNSALISLANYKIKSPTVPNHKIPKSELLKSCKKLLHVLVPTINLPVSKNGEYDNITSILAFHDEFLLVGGINAPKKIACRGSNGVIYNMLLKGEDDIRQDAVMQQVFGIVNNLLASDRHTKEDRLIIRTYKVVPLSRHSGIIEWCNGTEPIGKLLTGIKGSEGYHGNLRPNDMPAPEARKLMMSMIKATNEEKLNAFKRILSNFKPVFHHFFTLNFLSPVVWYERRLAYMRSVATSSMTGYILGLGDRHVQNILIDTETAEVIHIDFGIAFEQGKLQPTPETVPFRLTQDIVAGFGCTGMEGVFKKSCEKTMEVLKSNQEILLTILEVLLYDPLYIWTISEEQACKNQDILTSSLMTPSTANYATSSKVNEGSGSEAERALSRIRNKLEGTEFGSLLATAGQVARLLQQATDIKNLSRLFPGWQPYL